ncbi:MAG: hypothetical protein K0Q59_1173 [Paenibacillus sp.]|jgi:hypothetical protein|nr:hypothetical protein [Paenibacillus sp.]
MNPIILIMKQLAGRTPLQSLKPGDVWNAQLDEQISSAESIWASRGDVANKPMAKAVIAGLHLWNDSLAASHSISQHLETPEGSFWHAIMHRMEGDYWNSKYWYKQVGNHAVYRSLRQAAIRLADQHGLGASSAKASIEPLLQNSDWSPYRFVDAVQEQVERAHPDAAAALLQQFQRQEIALLLQHCYKAVGEEEAPGLLDD